jgi:hypothetical protein|tara:strand:+ start:272 stop:439 length:168 start_codon:yes stop_codon:yes gene_type:complete
MIITAIDCFYIMMIAVIFGFIIHLEVQIRLLRVMMEEHTQVVGSMKDCLKESKKT